jgi:outer membrane protein assembly factor BamB
MMKRILLGLGLCCLAFSARAGEAPDPLDNWHQWRGPLASGYAPRGKPPLKWDAQTNLKWHTPLPGESCATPIVWGDRVFALAAVDTGREAAAGDLPRGNGLPKKTQAPATYYQFLVYCLDRKSGKVLWKKVASEQVPHEGHHPSTTYAAGSPSTDGRRLYVSFGSFGIYCYDLDGNLQWKRDLGRMDTRLGWGEGTSPALYKDSLVVNWDHEGDSFIIVLDAATGKMKWKKDRNEKTSWNTPLVVEHKGRTQVIVNATNKVRSYDLATGKVLWQCGGLTVNAIPSPVTDGRFVYCMSGYRGSMALAIPLDAEGDVTDSDRVAWRHTQGTPYVPSPLLVKDRLWFTQTNFPILTCLDTRTGEAVLDRRRLSGLDSLYASPVCAAGRVYITGRNGTTVVLEQSDEARVLGVNRLGDPVDASPAIVGRQLFLRGSKGLYCFEEER